MRTNKTNVSTLTHRTEAALRRRIADGPIRVGDKLPTEKALAMEFGVSRTVIREAVAALRADGLLEAKHGVGVFVSSVPGDGTGSTSDLRFSAAVLDVLELRMAVEMSSAELAAARRSWSQEEGIWAAADTFATLVSTGEPTETSDWTFHRAIAQATNNAAFVEFFDAMGLALLPRRALDGGRKRDLITKTYLERSIGEHRAVCEAISAQSPEQARAAMRVHLDGSQSRYRRLVQAGRVPVADDVSDD